MSVGNKSVANGQYAVAEIVASYMVHMCGNALADVHVNYGKYLPADVRVHHKWRLLHGERIKKVARG